MGRHRINYLSERQISCPYFSVTISIPQNPLYVEIVMDVSYDVHKIFLRASVSWKIGRRTFIHNAITLRDVLGYHTIFLSFSFILFSLGVSQTKRSKTKQMMMYTNYKHNDLLSNKTQERVSLSFSVHRFIRTSAQTMKTHEQMSALS